jgi:hypothetical protein
MTTYQFTLKIDDGEYIALKAALEFMISHCEAKLAAGEGAPFWAHKHHCTEMLDRLRGAPTEMTSTSSFCWPERRRPKG